MDLNAVLNVNVNNYYFSPTSAKIYYYLPDYEAKLGSISLFVKSGVNYGIELLYPFKISNVKEQSKVPFIPKTFTCLIPIWLFYIMPNLTLSQIIYLFSNANFELVFSPFRSNQPPYVSFFISFLNIYLPSIFKLNFKNVAIPNQLWLTKQDWNHYIQFLPINQIDRSKYFQPNDFLTTIDKTSLQNATAVLTIKKLLAPDLKNGVTHLNEKIAVFLENPKYVGVLTIYSFLANPTMSYSQFIKNAYNQKFHIINSTFYLDAPIGGNVTYQTVPNGVLNVKEVYIPFHEYETLFKHKFQFRQPNLNKDSPKSTANTFSSAKIL